MLKHDPRWLMQRTRELTFKSRKLCEQARRASEHSKRLKETITIPRRKRLLAK